MRYYERILHKLVVSLVFTLLNWLIVNQWIVELPFWKYLIIELLLIVSLKFYIFTIQKLRL